MRSRPQTHARVLVLATGLLVLALPALGTVPSYAEPTPTPSASPGDEEAPLQVRVQRLLPRAPAPGQAFEVVGTLTNVGSQLAAGVRVQLRVGDRISTRGALHDADRDRPPTSRRVSADPARTDLAPGQTTTFDVRTTVAQLQLGEAGVYPLDIEATARYGDAGRARLGTAPTWVPWMAGQRVAPTRVAVVWPLVDEPHRDPADRLLDDALAGSLRAGRLSRLLAAVDGARVGGCEGAPAGPPPGLLPRVRVAQRCEAPAVTVAVDPDLLQTIASMTKPYTVHADGPARPGRGTDAANAWLDRLRSATTGSPVLALPFADPDVAALTRDLPGSYDLSLARALGTQVATDVLGPAPLTGVAWPPAGPVPPAAQDALATTPASGRLALVLDQAAFPAPPEEPDPTPDAHVPLAHATTGAELSALVPDPDLSTLVTGASAAALGPRLAEQRWIAETAIIASERPSVSRTLLVAPDRRGDVVPGVASPALQDIGRLPWLCPVTLADAAAGIEACPSTASGLPPAARSLGQPLLDSAGQLSPAFLDAVGASRDQATQFTDAVLDPRDPSATQTKARLRRAIARAESSAWRGDPIKGRQSAGLLRKAVDALEKGLTVHGAPLLLTSTKGTLSVSVDNRLDVPVTCGVLFDEVPGAVLSTYRTASRLIPAHSSAQLSVQATARTSGRFPVTVHLVGRDGRPFGEADVFVVRSTQYGRLALAVTGLGAGILLIAVGIRIVRRATGRGTGRPDAS